MLCKELWTDMSARTVAAAFCLVCLIAPTSAKETVGRRARACVAGVVELFTRLS